MDVRTQIINNILGALAGIDSGILDKIESVLHIQLKDYEIQERCTEVIVHDGSNLGLVRNCHEIIFNFDLSKSSHTSLSSIDVPRYASFLRLVCEDLSFAKM